MNERQMRRAYHRVNEFMADFDKEKRVARRVPLWRRLASALGWKRPLKRWEIRWEARHREAMHAARKIVARAMIAEERNAGRVKREKAAKAAKENMDVGK